MFFKIVLTFEFVNEILKCDHSNESYGAVLPCGAVYCTNIFSVVCKMEVELFLQFGFWVVLEVKR